MGKPEFPRIRIRVGDAWFTVEEAPPMAFCDYVEVASGRKFYSREVDEVRYESFDGSTIKAARS